MEFGRISSRVSANFLADQCGVPPHGALCKESEPTRVAAELYAGTCQPTPPSEEPGTDSWARAADREWDARKALNGTVARLVWYPEGCSPQLDVELRGGSGHPVVISSVDPGGYAAASGIKPGDRLLSIDGKKDFLQYPAAQIHASLLSPTTLVVAGFVGSIAAEVRVCNPMPEPEVVMRNVPSSSVLAEERVIKSTNIDSLFLTIGRHSSGAGGDAAPFLELSRGEAHNLKEAAVAALSLPSAKCNGKGKRASLCTATSFIADPRFEGGLGGGTWRFPPADDSTYQIGLGESPSTKDIAEPESEPRPLVVQQAALCMTGANAVPEENTPAVPAHLVGNLAQRGLSRGSSNFDMPTSQQYDFPRGGRCGTKAPPRVQVADNVDPSVNVTVTSPVHSDASDHDVVSEGGKLADAVSMSESDLQAI